ncbi:MAG: RNase adapter RapZ [Rhodobacteraceae bacterium]|nr:RNase adapter RapZ [Paracoccaceae bacterium]
MKDAAPSATQQLILVTGPSGGGRSTAINALEDMGYETIDNLPLSLVKRLLAEPLERPLALGIAPAAREFSANAFIEVIDSLKPSHNTAPEILYLDCRQDVLLRRYSETRRRHPSAPEETPMLGIEREQDLLLPIKARADVLIDTSELSPHDLKAELDRLYALEGEVKLAVTMHSFSYKRGLPRGIDMVFDCRFLRNPYWSPELRHLSGVSKKVQDYVSQDARYVSFFEQVTALAELLLPAYREEGKAHLSIAFGCTGGRHRSVTMAEHVASALAHKGWQVSIRHRELERTEASRRGTEG